MRKEKLLASKLEKKFLDSYNAHLLSLATENARPGMLLETDWGFLGLGTPEFRREEGWAWDFVTDINEGDFKEQAVDVNVVGHKISGKHSFASNINLPQYGLTVGSDFDREFSTLLTLTEVRARTFVSGKAKYELREALLKLPENERKWVNDDLLISTCYYVKQFVAEFRTLGKGKVKVALEEAEQTIGGDISINWENDSTFVADLRTNVPLFVRGIKV
jgi:hypothetical protein